jgi:hypothetical protein
MEMMRLFLAGAAVSLSVVSQVSAAPPARRYW